MSSSQTAEPDHRFAGEQLVPAESEESRFDDHGIDREGWVKVEKQRKTDRIRVRVRDRHEHWTIEIRREEISVEGPHGEARAPDWVRDVVTWPAIDPSLSAARIP